jgi:hypothetical protein
MYGGDNSFIWRFGIPALILTDRQKAEVPVEMLLGEIFQMEDFKNCR